MPRPCIGSCIEHLDLKIPYLMDRFESKNGPVDCIFIGQSSEDYERYIAETMKCADRHHVLFWPTTQLNHIPDDGWINRNHLNYTGAQIFSRWLGEKVGDAVNQGLLSDPVQ